MAAIVASMAVFSTIGGDATTVVIALALGLAGLGLGMASPSLNSSVANSVPEEHLGVASAAIGMMSSIGGVVGMELIRSFQGFRARSGVAVGDSYGQAYLFAAGIALLALVAALFVRRLAVEEPETVAATRAAA